jgi:hypothetical protein
MIYTAINVNANSDTTSSGNDKADNANDNANNDAINTNSNAQRFQQRDTAPLLLPSPTTSHRSFWLPVALDTSLTGLWKEW